jgi:hypothetical protein
VMGSLDLLRAAKVALLVRTIVVFVVFGLFEKAIVRCFRPGTRRIANPKALFLSLHRVPLVLDIIVGAIRK